MSARELKFGRRKRDFWGPEASHRGCGLYQFSMAFRKFFQDLSGVFLGFLEAED